MRRCGPLLVSAVVLLGGCGCGCGCGSGTADASVSEAVGCGLGRAELSVARSGEQVVARLRLTGLEPGSRVIADITQGESPLDEGTVTVDRDGRATLAGRVPGSPPPLVAASVVPTRRGGPECRLRVDTAALPRLPSTP